MAEKNIIRDLLLRIGVEADEKELEDFEKGLAKARNTMLALIAASTAAAAAITALVVATSEEVDEAGKLAESLGLSVEAMTELQFAAGQAGIDSSKLSIGLKTLARNMEAFSRGSGEAQEALKGVNLQAADGSLVELDVAVERIADKFAKLEDPVKKAAFAQRIFGESGTSMNLLLKDGAAGVQALRMEAAALGITISGEAAEAAADLNDELARSAGVVAGLRRRFAIGLAPALEGVSQRFRELIGENQEFIETKVDQAVTLTTAAARIAIPVLAGLTAGVIALTVATVPLATIFSPIVLTVLGITAAFVALVAIVDDVILTFQGGDTVIRRVGMSIGQFIVDLVDGFGIALDSLGEFFDYVAESISSAMEPVVEIFEDILGYIAQIMDFSPGELLSDGLDFIGGGIDSAAGFVGDLFGGGDTGGGSGGGMMSAGSEAMTLAASPAGGGSTTNVGGISIDARGMDPVQVGQEVRRALDEQATLASEASGGA